jgi:uncharacterized alkaline shock family protein YloU
VNLGAGIELSDGAFGALVVRAAEGVDGVRVRRPRKIALDGDRLELALAARLGLVLPDVARDVQARVHEAVETMCGIALAAVDVTVEEVDV